MDTVAAPPQTLGPSEIAKDWARRGYAVSRQYVDKLIKRGMRGERLDTSSLDRAWQWIEARRTSRTSFRRDANGGAENHSPGAPGNGAGSAPLDERGSLEMELEWVRNLVRQQGDLWRDAVKAKPYDAFAAARARKEYLDAVKTRVEVETLIADYEKSRGLQVSLVDAQRLIDDRLAPLRVALHGLDGEIAKELFSEEPAKHRPRIRSVIARVLVQSRAIAIAKRRLRNPALADVGARAA